MKIEIYMTYSKNEKGQALIVTVMVVLFASVVIGLTIAGLSAGEIASSANQNKASLGFELAEIGINDAIQKMERDRNYGNPSASYNLTIGSGTVSVVISGNSTTRTVTATGSYDNRNRTIQSVVGINSISKVTLTSWGEQ